MKRIQDTDTHFVERMGQLFEMDGMTRIAGRIYGHLLLSAEPLSLDDLTTALQVSKGSASQDTRLLERIGLLDRVTVPGDRRVYYSVSGEGHDRMLTVRQERMERLRNTLEDGLRTCAARTEDVRDRLATHCEFYDHMIRTISEAKQSWLRERSGKSKSSINNTMGDR